MVEKRTVTDNSGEISFGKEAISKVYLTGNIAEVVTVQKRTNNLKRFLRQDKDHYLDLSTGEVGEYRHSEYKLANPSKYKKKSGNHAAHY